MNENIDLTEILEGLEGIELYSSICGYCKLEKIRKGVNFSIMISFIDKNGNKQKTSLTKNGCWYCNVNSGECLLFPSKEQRDWSIFQRLIPINTPMMCSNNKSEEWKLCYYKELEHNQHQVFFKGKKSFNDNSNIDVCYKYVIPFDKFDPNNIEESLKYNIQK